MQYTVDSRIKSWQREERMGSANRSHPYLPLFSQSCWDRVRHDTEDDGCQIEVVARIDSYTKIRRGRKWAIRPPPK